MSLLHTVEWCMGTVPTFSPINQRTLTRRWILGRPRPSQVLVARRKVLRLAECGPFAQSVCSFGTLMMCKHLANLEVSRT
jgi:hypothetical protein